MNKSKSRSTLPSRGLPEVLSRAETVRHGGHLVDRKLGASNLNKALRFFDDLAPAEQMKIEAHDIQIEGLQFSVTQEKMIHALYLLLKEASISTDAKSKLFYKGNVRDSEDRAVIRITRAALYKAYTGKVRYSGKDMREIDEILIELSNRKYFVRYERHRWEGQDKKKKKVDQLREFINLFFVKAIDMDLTLREADRLDRGEQRRGRGNRSWLEITFDSIFTDQIGSKYIEYPVDINQRMAKAAGGARRVTLAMTRLRDHLLRARASKHPKLTMDESTLTTKLGLEKYINEGRKSLAQKYKKQAIDACGNLDLYKSHKIEQGKKGQPKHVFELNPDFN